MAQIVNLDRIATHFKRDWSSSLDGHEIDVAYQPMGQSSPTIDFRYHVDMLGI